MKLTNFIKRTAICLYLVLVCVFTQSVRGQNSHNLGEYNIYIGKDIAKYSVNGSYNIIIIDSADYELQNLNKSYLFIVDYNCEFLKRNPEIKGYLKAIKKYGFVCGGLNAMKENRKEIWVDISEMVLNAH